MLKVMIIRELTSLPKHMFVRNSVAWYSNRSEWWSAALGSSSSECEGLSSMKMVNYADTEWSYFIAELETGASRLQLLSAYLQGGISQPGTWRLWYLWNIVTMFMCYSLFYTGAHVVDLREKEVDQFLGDIWWMMNLLTTSGDVQA